MLISSFSCVGSKKTRVTESFVQILFKFQTKIVTQRAKMRTRGACFLFMVYFLLNCHVTEMITYF